MNDYYHKENVTLQMPSASENAGEWIVLMVQRRR